MEDPSDALDFKCQFWADCLACAQAGRLFPFALGATPQGWLCGLFKRQIRVDLGQVGCYRCLGELGGGSWRWRWRRRWRHSRRPEDVRRGSQVARRQDLDEIAVDSEVERAFGGLEQLIEQLIGQTNHWARRRLSGPGLGGALIVVAAKLVGNLVGHCSWRHLRASRHICAHLIGLDGLLLGLLLLLLLVLLLLVVVVVV